MNESELGRHSALDRRGNVRQVNRRQGDLEARSHPLHVRRKLERGAQLRGGLVQGEPRAVGGDLVEHSARLPKVDRAEVAADPSPPSRRRQLPRATRAAPAARHHRPRGRPRDERCRLHRFRSRTPACGEGLPPYPGRSRRIRSDSRLSSDAVARNPILSVRKAAEPASPSSQMVTACTPRTACSPGTGPPHPGMSPTRGVAMISSIRPSGSANASTCSLKRRVGSLELHPARQQSLDPEPQRCRGHGEPDSVDLTRTLPARPTRGPREEREQRPRMAELVPVVEVVPAGIVVVDGDLYQAHAERAGVEVQIALRLPDDRGDVMDAHAPFHNVTLSEAKGSSHRFGRFATLSVTNSTV